MRKKIVNVFVIGIIALAGLIVFVNISDPVNADYTSNLVGRWKMDETSWSTAGSVLDSSGNENPTYYNLIVVLDNWETIFEQVESGNKYNKNLILSYIRELSGLTTKDIRVSMRRYKKIYVALKNLKIDKGSL